MAANDGLKVYDIHMLLSRPERDYLLRNNNDQVAVISLKGKKLGLYFSASWSVSSERFTLKLVEAYNELVAKGDFEVILISDYEDIESFHSSFSKMPWLAIPFTDSKTQNALYGCFKVTKIPFLVFLDENGKLLTDNGAGIIEEYGAEGYPFTPEHVKAIKEQKEEVRRNQSLRSILELPSCNFFIASKALVTKLEGKMVGLYFTLPSNGICSDITAILVNAYNELKAKGENFEIVMIPFDNSEESFGKAVSSVPWFSLPFNDKNREKLAQYFNLSTLPTLVIIGPDGKTLHPDVTDAIVHHGANAYPFTPDKFSELEKIEKARQEAQTLGSVLVSGDLDFVVGKTGVKIPVTKLVGKYILLYFSALRCAPFGVAYPPQFVETYRKIKAEHGEFEVIFMSYDENKASYEKFYSSMPWLTLPFGDERVRSASRLFKVKTIPAVVALNPNGRTITTKTLELILCHGAKAFPFTEERMAELEGEYNEMARRWPKQVKHQLHQELELVLTRTLVYECDRCHKEGNVWAYSNEYSNFHLHPECALIGTKGKEGM